MADSKSFYLFLNTKRNILKKGSNIANSYSEKMKEFCRTFTKDQWDFLCSNLLFVHAIDEENFTECNKLAKKLLTNKDKNVKNERN